MLRFVLLVTGSQSVGLAGLGFTKYTRLVSNAATEEQRCEERARIAKKDSVMMGREHGPIRQKTIAVSLVE